MERLGNERVEPTLPEAAPWVVDVANTASARNQLGVWRTLASEACAAVHIGLAGQAALLGAFVAERVAPWRGAEAQITVATGGAKAIDAARATFGKGGQTRSELGIPFVGLVTRGVVGPTIPCTIGVVVAVASEAAVRCGATLEPLSTLTAGSTSLQADCLCFVEGVIAIRNPCFDALMACLALAVCGAGDALSTACRAQADIALRITLLARGAISILEAIHAAVAFDVADFSSGAILRALTRTLSTLVVVSADLATWAVVV